MSGGAIAGLIIGIITLLLLIGAAAFFLIRRQKHTKAVRSVRASQGSLNALVARGLDNNPPPAAHGAEDFLDAETLGFGSPASAGTQPRQPLNDSPSFNMAYGAPYQNPYSAPYSNTYESYLFQDAVGTNDADNSDIDIINHLMA